MEIITICITSLVLVLVLVYLLRNKILLVMHYGLNIMLVLSILLVISALFTPGAYEFVADQSLRQAGTYQSVLTLDESLKNVVNTPQNIFKDILNIFNPNKNTTEEPVDSDKGPIETNVYPSFVKTLSFFYRITSVVIGLMGIFTIIYLSYSTHSSIELSQFKAKYSALEKRVEILESLNRQTYTPANIL